HYLLAEDLLIRLFFSSVFEQDGLRYEDFLLPIYFLPPVWLLHLLLASFFPMLILHEILIRIFFLYLLNRQRVYQMDRQEHLHSFLFLLSQIAQLPMQVSYLVDLEWCQGSLEQPFVFVA